MTDDQKDIGYYVISLLAFFVAVGLTAASAAIVVAFVWKYVG